MKFFKKRKTKEELFLEEEFEKGNINIPTDLRDFEDIEMFKEKTSHLKSVQEQLSELEDEKK